MGINKKDIRRKAQYHYNMKSFQQQLPNVLASAIQLHQSGNLRKAEELYNQILQSKPNHIDALHLLGVVAYQSGEDEKAVNLISKAIRENAAIPYFHNNLGNALKNKGDIDGAIKCFKEAIRLKPDYAEAYNNLGNAFEEKGDVEKTIHYFQKAIKAKPDYGEAYNNLGNALKKLGKIDEAVKHYKEAIKFKPHFAESHYNLGNALDVQGKFEEAIEHYNEAIRLKPDFYQACNNIGNVYEKVGDIDSAMACYREVLKQKPDFSEARHNLASAYNELGNTHEKNCELGEAIKNYDEALRIKPDLSEAHYNKGIALLLMGKMEEGWSEYEWRFQSEKVVEQIGKRTFTQPLWNGSQFSGETILVHTEQGIGDTFQFLRYMPMVKERGGRVVFECQKELARVLDGFPGIDQFVEKPADGITEVHFDTYVPLLSMPGVFGTTINTIPSEVPYLRADPQLVEKWNDTFDTKSFKVGLVWAGNPDHNNDNDRSCSLSDYLPLSSIPGLSLFSLQKGAAAIQLSELQGELNIVDLGDQLSDFSETAAVIASLDLLISVDTAVVHLAGAMGKPVWTLLPFEPDWRWMLDRSDSPWYPTMRLFRQSERGDWHRVMMTVALELEKLISEATMEKEKFPENRKYWQEVLMSADLDR